MAHVLEDLHRLFPKNNCILQSYLIGSTYLLNKKVRTFPQQKFRQPQCAMQKQIKPLTITNLALKFLESKLVQPKIRLSQDSSEKIIQEFRFVRIENYIHVFPKYLMNSPKQEDLEPITYAEFSLDELETVKSEYTTDFDDQEYQKSFMSEQSSTSELSAEVLTRSCVF